ncbi:contactin-associated protein-like 5 [Manis pentadactyla]|uniref:contactin-associated protein-like 5 n=1 Tax=Manis pentadactyla TaxID=143292 RepID=UPI00255C4A68|nr:contactin-associated protein-like 5 [Manis pentadactyla]
MNNGVPFSWWVGRSGERHPSWTGAPTGAQQCGCSLDQSCLDVGHLCSCGSNKDGCIVNKLQEATLPYKRTNDTGLLSFRDHLPVTQIVITGTNRSNSEAAWRIGPLRCYGDPLSGVFLENLGIKDFIRLEISSPSEIMFAIDVGTGPVELIAQSPALLNDNQRTLKETSLQVESLARVSRETSDEGHFQLQLNSQLFVAEAQCTIYLVHIE